MATAPWPMFQMAKNRILDMVLKFILVTAIAHLGLMGLYSVFTGDFSIWNYFAVLQLNLFFPEIAIGDISYISSAGMVVAVNMVIFTFYTRKEPKFTRA